MEVAGGSSPNGSSGSSRRASGPSPLLRWCFCLGFARPVELALTVSGAGGGVREAVPLLVEILDAGLP